MKNDNKLARVYDGGVINDILIVFSALYKNGPYFLFQRLLKNVTQIKKKKKKLVSIHGESIPKKSICYERAFTLLQAESEVIKHPSEAVGVGTLWGRG